MKTGNGKKSYVWVYDLGRIRFLNAWKLQKELVERRAKGLISDVLLIAEHEHVFTCGKSLLSSNTPLNKISGIPFYFVERGGSETYHGPGQIMGYPILKLVDSERNVELYLRKLEELLIRTAMDFGLLARRIKGYTGVWVGKKKIASIGVAVKHWVTYHGFAINHDPDLSMFQLINPCGLNPKYLSSIHQLVGKQIGRGKIISSCLNHFEDLFDRSVITGDKLEGI